MNRIAFYGTIYTGDFEVVRKILLAWVGADELDVKIKLSGEEITYESETLYLYCHNVVGQTDNPRYLLEGNASGGLEETKQKLEKLLQLCKENNVVCSSEYVEVNEAGDEVSEQFQVE